MTTLSMPLICECGFNTMDAKEALNHIRDKHPEIWVETEEQDIAENMKDYWLHQANGAEPC